MPPTIDGGDVFVGIGGPDEGLGSGVGFHEDAIDGGLQIDDWAEDASLQAAAGQLGEVAFDRVEPGRGCRGEVEEEAGMALELSVLMGPEVVEDHVDQFSGRHLCLDGVEETDEFLMPVALYTATDNLPSSTLRAANSVVVP